MTKTTKMLLIEERAGRDIREVMTAAYDETQNIRAAADLIETRYGVPLSYSVFADWVEVFEGRLDRTLRFPNAADVSDTQPGPDRERAAAAR
jgi:hypothetical protein